MEQPTSDLKTLPMLDRILQTLDARRQQSLSGLLEFLRIPSVSTKPEHAPDLRRCAEWLAGQFRSAGLEAEIHLRNRRRRSSVSRSASGCHSPS